MSILGSVLKVCGTIVEGAGKTIVDCVNEIERDNKEYKQTVEYKKAKAEREEIIAEMKVNLKRIETGVSDLIRTTKKK